MSQHVMIAVTLAVIVFVAAMYWRRAKRQLAAFQAAEWAKAEATEREDRRQRQLALGDKFFAALCAAAMHNPANRVRVQRLGNNGGSYSIIVGWAESSSATHGGLDYAGYPVFQLDIKLWKMESPVHLFTGPYGPDEYFGVNEWEVRVLLARLTKAVREYSPYAVQTAAAS
jgi:hypothetical protein